ncbi:hypothetical protein BS50DRAFT_579427 [Corynespora cassiicola Philippines]|uniref:ASX DEUBAD domain-containing protein n=1 Tax=Corynespora cassiicola Philippines TaxID=1448308 RepID=A0A2T2N5I3_CORCC|nr:hypothetical protein BS50DRAFT_579427 [Corynespora cassiicola Philippines]
MSSPSVTKPVLSSPLYSPVASFSPTTNKKRTHEDPAAANDQPAPKKRTAKTIAAAKPANSNRPVRARKAPARFDTLQEPVKQPALAPKKTKVYDPVYMTTHSTSRLRKADIYHLLLEPAAWDSLAAGQELELVSMLPRTVANESLAESIKAGVEGPTRPMELSASFDVFRTDVAKFVEDLAAGHLAKGWQQAAVQAVRERAAGHFDSWKAQESEAWWGQKAG